MAMTYTTAAARDAARIRSRSVAAFDRWELALLAVSMLAVLLAWTTLSRAAGVRGLDPKAPAPVNLNAVADASALDPIVSTVLPGAADRRLAARAIFAFLVQADGQRRVVSEVRSLSRARIDAAVIDRTPAAAVYRGRLADERARAAAEGQPAPTSVAALTPSELTAVKPLLAVRTAPALRRTLLLWCLVYVLAFQAVSLVWRVRGVRGDRMLLVCAHVLTAFGLAAMISRPDPIRDAILFVRFVEGVVGGLAVAAILSSVNVRTAVVRSLSYELAVNAPSKTRLMYPRTEVVAVAGTHEKVKN